MTNPIIAAVHELLCDRFYAYCVTDESTAVEVIAAVFDNLDREAMAKAIGRAHDIEPDDADGMLRTSDFLVYVDAAIAAAREVAMTMEGNDGR